MKTKEIVTLGRGDLVRRDGEAIAFLVVQGYGNRAWAVQGTEITNPPEWVAVNEKEAEKALNAGVGDEISSATGNRYLIAAKAEGKAAYAFGVQFGVQVAEINEGNCSSWQLIAKAQYAL